MCVRSTPVTQSMGDQSAPFSLFSDQSTPFSIMKAWSTPVSQNIGAWRAQVTRKMGAPSAP